MKRKKKNWKRKMKKRKKKHEISETKKKTTKLSIIHEKARGTIDCIDNKENHFRDRGRETEGKKEREENENEEN